MYTKYHPAVKWLVLLVTLLPMLLLFNSNFVMAGAMKYTEGIKTKFTPSYRTHDGKVGSVECADTPRVCLDINSEKIIQGVKVTRPCWQYGYGKTCQIYPSENDCVKWRHCYVVADRECLTWDSYGNCVNLQREFSCKRWIPAEVENQKARMGLTEKDGQEGLVCRGVPCIDGNCVDKSYETNGEMMDSVSKLYMVSKIRDAKDFNFKIFAGFNSHCSKKATGYINCCAVSLKGWGNHLGAHCNSDEKQLIENRKKNLCVYVGKENRGIMKTVVKYHYCCFGNSLQKVVQVEGRKQLYAKGLISSTEKNFGSGGNPNCRGLTLAELQNLDFDKMDLTEFIEDFKLKFAGKYKAPNVGDITIRIKGTATSNIRKGDNNPHNKGNNKSGWSTKIGDD